MIADTGNRRIRKVEGIAASSLITAVLEDYAALRPQRFTLEQNFPNPFNSSTVIRFELPQSGEVELAVYNLAGQKVAALARGARQAGTTLFAGMGRMSMGRSWPASCTCISCRRAAVRGRRGSSYC